MSFGDIPIRENGIDQLIEASWFNTFRTKLIEAFGTGSYMFVQETQTIADDAAISTEPTAFKPFIPVVGDAAPVEVNALPFGAHAFNDGKEIVIMGTDDVNTVKLNFNDAANGLIINGESVTLKKWHKITLMWWAEGQRFVELERNF